MSWLLAIDCSDQSCSVALGSGSELLEEYTSEPRQHAQRVLPMMRTLLANAGIEKSALDGIAVAIGPGSFTGLRIALSVAQALAYGLARPLITVSSLAALAERYSVHDVPKDSSASLCVALDARMDEVYCAKFEVVGDEIHRRTDDLLLSVADAQAFSSTSEIAIGSAFALDSLSSTVRTYEFPAEQVHASDVYKLAKPRYEKGEITSPAGLEPAYLRRETAWKKLDQQ